MTQSFFEKKIRPVLIYAGSIGAVAMSVAYIILMFVLVLGFKAQSNLTQSLMFSGVNAIVGFIIMQFLKIQGIDFAKQLPHNQEILKAFNGVKKKKKTTHSLKYFWIKSITSDLVIKGISLFIATAGIIYIVIEGSNDYNMLLMSLVNLIMFACFGFLSLVKSYDFFNENYIPYVEEQINEKRRNTELRQEKEDVEVVETKPIEQRDIDIHTDRRVDILESSDNHIYNGDIQSLVLNDNTEHNSFLGRTIYSRSDVTTSIDTGDEETIQQID